MSSFPEKIVAASVTLVLMLVAGMTPGSTLGGYSVEIFGPRDILILLAIIYAFTVATSLFHLWHGESRSKNPVTVATTAANFIPKATLLYP